MISSAAKPHPLLPVAIATAALAAATATTLFLMGRLPLGPDGKFGWYEWNIWSSECSQRVLDPYACSHFIHGILFYGFLWLVARKLPVRWRFVLAIAIEAAWELFENSPFTIDRYRQTAAAGYTGDSILNSMSDLTMMALGFLTAYRVKIWHSLLIILVLEIGCLFWIRDNLTLNVLMLVHPFEGIKAWQSVH